MLKKTLLKILCGLIALFVIIQIIPPIKAADVNTFAVAKGDRPLVIAHGGAKLLYPENTMVAFDGSKDMGVDVLEMDVCLTKDEVLVTHHDLTIDRMSDGKGNVRDYTYVELAKFNFGYGFEDLNGQYPYKETQVVIPTLEDVIKNHGDMPMVIELKDVAEYNGFKAAEKLKELLEKYNVQDNVIVGSFHDDVLSYFKKITKGSVKTSTASGETGKFVKMNLAFVGLFYRGSDVALQIPVKHSGINLASKRLIKAAQRRNMAVQYWTINDKEEMKRLIELGADGIITDRPDIMKELLTEMGY